ncbi:hypothetical protein [uncultured Aureimonas sp.]|uniref:hypothetical protein n=1 Tax=uncultured Aureimonas sp. TaxID=1604662 RepID=UPI0025FDA687|nr:hypothetical protein [uncultured Aureimonas sp.]
MDLIAIGKLLDQHVIPGDFMRHEYDPLDDDLRPYNTVWTSEEAETFAKLSDCSAIRQGDLVSHDIGDLIPGIPEHFKEWIERKGIFEFIRTQETLINSACSLVFFSDRDTMSGPDFGSILIRL